VRADCHTVLCSLTMREVPAHGPKSSSVVSGGCARCGCCCNRHVRQALSWLYWLKITSRNLPFLRHHRVMGSVASIGEDLPVRVRPHVDREKPSPACHEHP
jgi:hypothetical protein